MANTTPSMPEIISMEVCGVDDSEYRIRAGDRIRYAVVAPGTFDRPTLSMPLDAFPPLPYQDDWTVAHISRDPDTNELTASLSSRELAGVDGADIWHPVVIDCLWLKKLELLTPATYECSWSQGQVLHRYGSQTAASNPTMIAKIARFEWEMPRIVQETRAYRLLEGTGLAPRFLGHIHEHGRIMGFLLEKIQGREGGVGDLSRCRDALGRLHSLGVVHGDVNRYNFLVGEESVRMIDFEGSVVGGSQSLMEKEMHSLVDELAETTGRGGGFIFEGEVDGADEGRES